MISSVVFIVKLTSNHVKCIRIHGRLRRLHHKLSLIKHNRNGVNSFNNFIIKLSSNHVKCITRAYTSWGFISGKGRVWSTASEERTTSMSHPLRTSSETSMAFKRFTAPMLITVFSSANLRCFCVWCEEIQMWGYIDCEASHTGGCFFYNIPLDNLQ